MGETTMTKKKCAHCGCLTEETAEAPGKWEHKAWRDLASDHHQGCRWITTRAYQMGRSMSERIDETEYYRSE